MKTSLVTTALSLAMSAVTIGPASWAFAQSATGQASSGGVAGGDSAGAAGSAAGGNGPSETGEAASGGVAGGDAVWGGGDAGATGSRSRRFRRPCTSVTGSVSAQVSGDLESFAERAEFDQAAAVQELSETEAAALTRECEAISSSANRYSAGGLAACEALR